MKNPPGHGGPGDALAIVTAGTGARWVFFARSLIRVYAPGIYWRQYKPLLDYLVNCVCGKNAQRSLSE
jgi:hypothetical protein